MSSADTFLVLHSTFDSKEYEFSWNTPRLHRFGILIGSWPGCDIAINHPAISGFAGLITFDSQDRLVYYDTTERGYSRGSKVTIGSSCNKRRRRFAWILSDTEFLDEVQPKIKINLHEHIEFNVHIATHDRNSIAYKENVAAFRDASSADMPVLDGQVTVCATAAQTNAGREIFIQYGSICQSGYGHLNRYYNVSTGVYVARSLMVNMTSWDIKESWEKEYELMMRIQEGTLHDADMKQYSQYLLTFVSVEAQHIDIECVSGDSLSHQMALRPFSEFETILVMEQLLKALAVLHSRDPPIIHGSLKPQCILFQHRGNSGEADLHIKVTDFGCFKQRPTNIYELERAQLYMAPEQFYSSMYTSQNLAASCDVWAVGVIIFEMIHKFEPRPSTVQGVPCWQGIHDTIENTHSRISAFVARYMVCQDPKQRLSAKECLSMMGNISTWTGLAQASTYSDTKHWL